ncbi:RNA methyltransferase [Muriicola soli]|uniref:RNA methyltransferase n=1 Tax=Muriicola soli TaxID=2507538 RepID=UPI00319E0C18
MNGLFVAEGVKLVNELLQADLTPEGVYTTDPKLLIPQFSSFEVISESVLQKMSGLKTPNKVLAVFRIPESKQAVLEEWTLALDGVKDPGNLGTIIRLCDWFGIPQIICSEDTVDCYNPKVLQATMGSIARVKIVYTSLATLLKDSEHSAWGADMHGENIYDLRFPTSGILVMGNEAHGISDEVGALLAKKVSIPQVGPSTAESLNVATATAVLLSELRRKGS